MDQASSERQPDGEETTVFLTDCPHNRAYVIEVSATGALREHPEVEAAFATGASRVIVRPPARSLPSAGSMNSARSTRSPTPTTCQISNAQQLLVDPSGRAVYTAAQAQSRIRPPVTSSGRVALEP